MEAGKAIKGNLQKTRFPEALLKVASRKETGVLRVGHQQIEKTIYLQEGNVIFSSSNDVDDRLGPLLLRQKKINLRQLTDSEPKVSPSKRLGAILVLDGYIQPEDLVRGVTDQVKEIIYSLFPWEEGTFQFVPGPLPTNEIITLNLSIPDLVFNGMTRISRWSWISKGVGGLDEVFRKRAGWTTVLRKMMTTTETEALLDLFDRPRTLEEILQLSPLASFETCKQIWFFLIVGIIEQILQAPQWEDEDDEIEFLDTTTSEASLEATVSNHLENFSDAIAPATVSEVAEPASPTLKIDLPPVFTERPSEANETADPNTARIPSQSLTEVSQSVIASQPFPAEMIEPPDDELSFSDLADLTDTAQEIPVSNTFSAEPTTKRADIQVELRAFNDLHRYIFEIVRLEIGPGVVNFILKTLKKATAKFPLLFEGVQMNDFGELDPHALTVNVEGNLVENYQEGLAFLLEEERAQIRIFLEPKRVNVIEAGLKKMLDRQKSVIG